MLWISRGFDPNMCFFSHGTPEKKSKKDRRKSRFAGSFFKKVF